MRYSNHNQKNILDSKYFNGGNLSIPSGINNFINDVLNNNLTINEQNDIQRIKYIQNRRNRLTSNNLIIGTTFTVSNNYDNRYDKDNFKQWRLKVKTAGNLTSLFVKENPDGFKRISDFSAFQTSRKRGSTSHLEQKQLQSCVTLLNYRHA